MQLKVAICEDDRILCEDVQRRILEIRPDYIIDTYSTGEELLLIDKGYDIMFLDIEMPGKNGMCIARELREKKYSGHIVFLTSHTEFMPEAFKVKAFRFLYVEAQKNKTVIYTLKDVLETNYTLKYWIQELGTNAKYV